MRIREGIVGAEFQHLLPNLALGANLSNQRVRDKWKNTNRTAGGLITGRLLIIGGIGLTLRKTIISQEATKQVTKKHDTQHDVGEETNTIENIIAIQKYTENEIEE